MRDAEDVVAALRASAQLWEVGPGLVGLRGPALALLQALERTVTDLTRRGAHEEWRVPPAVSFATLARSGYFASFPQWLTVASHLTGDPLALERVAEAADPAAELAGALAPPQSALAPAVCYHAYAGLAGNTFDREQRITLQATCWRHEGDQLRPLERGWAFTMREVVCVGPADAVARFLEEAQAWVTGLARRLGLSFQVEEASDPFFAPTARGRALLQRVKGLKRELTLPIGPGRWLAVASLNDHELYFGNAFDMKLPSGEPASSACVAFGLERWLLAFLVEHGLDLKAWPAIPDFSEERR
jgi:seryl-tRNA synthetase